jgi:hypothetical protein
MTDDIRQQLEEAWPGEWYGGAFSDYYLDVDCSSDLKVCVSSGAALGEKHHGWVYVNGRSLFPRAAFVAGSPTQAALALRERAEILVDALERMEAVDG